MHRHGTMKGRWKALAFGSVWVVAGFFLARPGWRNVFAGDVPTPPSGSEVFLIFGGGFLMVVGAVLGLTPLLLWLLRSFYKEDFAPDARCPIMVVCPACRAYNPRIRSACSTCRGSLEGAKAAGSDSAPVVGAE